MTNETTQPVVNVSGREMPAPDLTDAEELIANMPTGAGMTDEMQTLLRGLSIQGDVIMLDDEPVTRERLMEFAGLTDATFTQFMSAAGISDDFVKALNAAVTNDADETKPPRKVRRALARGARKTGRAAKTTVLVPWHLTTTGLAIMMDGLRKAGHTIDMSSRQLARRFNAWLDRHPYWAAFFGLVLAGAGMGITIAVMYIVFIVILIAILSIIGLAAA